MNKTSLHKILLNKKHNKILEKTNIFKNNDIIYFKKIYTEERFNNELLFKNIIEIDNDNNLSFIKENDAIHFSKIPRLI
jgi:hypothetical protein